MGAIDGGSRDVLIGGRKTRQGGGYGRDRAYKPNPNEAVIAAHYPRDNLYGNGKAEDLAERSNHSQDNVDSSDNTRPACKIRINDGEGG